MRDFTTPPKTSFAIVRRMRHSSWAFHIIKPRNRFNGRCQGPQVGPAHMTIDAAMRWLENGGEK